MQGNAERVAYLRETRRAALDSIERLKFKLDQAQADLVREWDAVREIDAELQLIDGDADAR